MGVKERARSLGVREDKKKTQLLQVRKITGEIVLEKIIFKKKVG